MLETRNQSLSVAGKDAGPGWIIFSVLATLGLVDSVAMLATNSFGFPIGLGWNKLIFASFQGLALSASASYKIYFLLASTTAQLGVIALFFLFSHLARHRSVRGYVTGIVIYALGALLALSNNDFMTVSIHLIGLMGLIFGLVKLRVKLQVVRESENDDSAYTYEPAGKRLRLRTLWAAGCGGLLITTIILTGVGVLSGIISSDPRTFYTDMEQKIMLDTSGSQRSGTQTASPRNDRARGVGEPRAREYGNRSRHSPSADSRGHGR